MQQAQSSVACELFHVRRSSASDTHFLLTMPYLTDCWSCEHMLKLAICNGLIVLGPFCTVQQWQIASSYAAWQPIASSWYKCWWPPKTVIYSPLRWWESFATPRGVDICSTSHVINVAFLVCILVRIGRYKCLTGLDLIHNKYRQTVPTQQGNFRRVFGIWNMCWSSEPAMLSIYSPYIAF